MRLFRGVRWTVAFDEQLKRYVFVQGEWHATGDVSNDKHLRTLRQYEVTPTESELESFAKRRDENGLPHDNGRGRGEVAGEAPAGARQAPD